MNRNIGWYFPSTSGGPRYGYKDASLAHFGGVHEHYLAREIIQNSIDARRNHNEKVKVVFELKKVPPSEISGIDSLSKYFELAKDYTSEQDGAPEFYQNAIDILSSKEILVLRAGDYNTKGLDGADDDDNNNWSRLVLMEGASSLKGAGGGSYGIGKNAAFSASSLRTVFYVSRNSANELVFQGKTKLSTFRIDDDYKQGTGLFGDISAENLCSSIRGDENIPDFFQRDGQGTDVYIIGYNSSNEDWKKGLLESVLTNFWPAIQDKDLEVELIEPDGQSTLVDNSNLHDLLVEDREIEQNTLPFFIAYTQTKPVIKTLNHLGEVKLFVKKREDFPRMVQLMRKPKMIVQTKRVHTLHDNYAAVFICENESGNEILRSVEPPAHDKWDKNLKEGQHKAALNELSSFLRETLREMNPFHGDEPEDIPDAGKYVADIEERDDLDSYNAGLGEDTKDNTEDESPREIAVITPPIDHDATMVRNQNLTIISSARGEDSNRLGIKDRTNKTNGDRASDDEDGNLPRIDTSSFSFRSFVTNESGQNEYHIVLSPTKDTKGAIKIMAVGEDSEYPVDIKSIKSDDDRLVESEGSLVKEIELKKGIPLRLSLELTSNRRYALGVESHEN